jgi:hypothetical protein
LAFVNSHSPCGSKAYTDRFFGRATALSVDEASWGFELRTRQPATLESCLAQIGTIRWVAMPKTGFHTNAER